MCAEFSAILCHFLFFVKGFSYGDEVYERPRSATCIHVD